MVGVVWSSRGRRRAAIIVGMLALSILATVVVTVAQSENDGDMAYACIDSRNGALYGVQVDSDNVRCSRGDDQISWALGEPESGGGTEPGGGSEPDDDSDPGGGSIGLAFVGSWEPGINYLAGNVVEHEGSSYVSIATSPQVVEPPNEDYWRLLALRGEPAQDGQDGEDGADGQDGADGPTGERGLTGQQGPFGLDGEGFAWRDVFSSSATYARNDVVHYDGSAWVSSTDEPAGSPDTSGDWDLFVQGVDEANGNSGENGNGGGGAAAFHHVEEAMSITGSDLQNGTATATCPAHAPRIVSGGYHLADGNGNYLTEFNTAYMNSPRGNGPELDPGGHDRWRVSWGQLTSASAGDAVVVHAYCVESLGD